MGITSDFKSKKRAEFPKEPPMPTAPSRLHMTKAEAMAHEKKILDARKAAKKIYEEKISEGGENGVQEEKRQEEVSKPVEPAVNPFVKKSKKKSKETV